MLCDDFYVLRSILVNKIVNIILPKLQLFIVYSAQFSMLPYTLEYLITFTFKFIYAIVVPSPLSLASVNLSSYCEAGPLCWLYWFAAHYAPDSHEFHIFYTLRIFTAHIDHIYKSIGALASTNRRCTASRQTDKL